ncbi:hypothetical protein K1719_015468 [Acacia pycnantha]|nr:hypothetical protein K1719_015468 [Acacia pycnantha]
MSTRNTTNPEDLLPFDLEIERTILTARRVVRLSHKINTELDTQLESDSHHSDCDHSVDLSDCASDSISDNLVVFTDSSSNFANSEIMAEEQADRHTLKELAAPDFLDLSSLQTALPDSQLAPPYHGGNGIAEPWLPQSVTPYISSAGQVCTSKCNYSNECGGLTFMAAQPPSSQIPNIQTQGPVASFGGNPFA